MEEAKSKRPCLSLPINDYRGKCQKSQNRIKEAQCLVEKCQRRKFSVAA